MKLLILSLLFVTVKGDFSEVFKEKIMKEFKKFDAECSGQESSGDNPSTKELGCVFACLNEKVGIQNEDGTINNEGMKKFLLPLKKEDSEKYEKILELMAECMSDAETVEGRCARGNKMNECGETLMKKFEIDIQ